MVTPTSTDPLIPSILDRLLDFEPEQRIEPSRSRTQVINELKESVRRDLEFLLNTRRRWGPPSTHHQDTDMSLLDYGIPDYSNQNLNDDTIKSEFIKLLENIIIHNETRFSAVKVQAHHHADTIDRTFRFRIEALLNVEPALKPIAFDSSVDPVTRNFVVKDAENGR